MTTENRILEKIRKALALAKDKRGDPHTAAIALKQAQALMRQHNLDERAVDAAACGQLNYRSQVSVKNPPHWEVKLVNMVCEAFACKPIWHAGGPEPTNKGFYSFVGPKGHLDVAIHTTVVLMRALLKARFEYVAKMPNHWNKAEKTQDGDSFCVGWVLAVKETVDAYSDPDGVLARARQAYVELNFPRLGQAGVRHRDNITKDAFSAGTEQGSKVRLRRPMNSADEKLKLN